MHWEAGQPLKPRPEQVVTREQLWEYADASSDRNAIHLHDEFATAAGFPSVIVHGMLSMAFLADLVALNFPEAQFRVGRLKTKFRKVTFPGDKLRCEGKVKSVQPDGKLFVTFAVINQNGDTTADGDAEITPR